MGNTCQLLIIVILITKVRTLQKLTYVMQNHVSTEPAWSVCADSQGFHSLACLWVCLDSKALGMEEGWGQGKVWTTQQKKARSLWKWDTCYFSGRCGLSSQFSRLTSSLDCAEVPGLTLTWLLLPKPWSPHPFHILTWPGVWWRKWLPATNSKLAHLLAPPRRKLKICSSIYLGNRNFNFSCRKKAIEGFNINSYANTPPCCNPRLW